MTQRVARCKKCQLAIVWCVTSAGRRMPVDPAPTQRGNLKVTPQGPLKSPLVEVVPERDRRPGQMLHTSHFASCAKTAKKAERPAKGQAQPADQGALFDPAPASSRGGRR